METVKLREYQFNAVCRALSVSENEGRNALIVLPTGAGKTIVIQQLCESITADFPGHENRRVLVCSHVKEIVEQTEKTIKRYDPYNRLGIGVYSAGLKRRDHDCRTLVAGIQSVYNKADEIGRFDVLIIDECHLIPPKGEGRYRTLISDLKRKNPGLTVIGLTATPYRMGGGYIYGPGRIFREKNWETYTSELIREGYLTKLTNKLGANKADFDSLAIKNGEFDSKEVDRLTNLFVFDVVDDFVEKTKDRNSVLVFASSVSNGRLIGARLRSKGCLYAEVYGETPTEVRDKTINDFKEGKVKYLVNMGVLTTGFDAPNVDCVVLARPTASPGLYVQMVGRGLRLYPGKENCLVLDYGGNISRHGPIDDIYMRDPSKRVNFKTDRPKLKLCKHCQTYNPPNAKVCSECGAEFERDEKPELSIAEMKRAILFEEKPFKVSVQKTRYYRHVSRKGTICLKVVYYCGQDFFQQFFIVDPTNIFYGTFVSFWSDVHKACDDEYDLNDTEDEGMRNFDKIPKTVDEAIRRINELGEVKEITVAQQRGSKFPKIYGWSAVTCKEDEKLFRKNKINNSTDGYNPRENKFWNEKRDGKTVNFTNN